MTKRELLAEYRTLCEQARIGGLDGIGENATKAAIGNAIACLNCSSELLDQYMVVVRLKYPNTAKIIDNSGDYKRHPYNRLYVYNTARRILQ